jgi:hypothetical protein
MFTAIYNNKIAILWIKTYNDEENLLIENAYMIY